MTLQDFKERLSTNGGIENLVYIQFNNSGIFYVWGDKEKFNPDTDLFTTDGGEDMIVCRGFFVDKTTSIKKHTIPHRVEKGLFTVEGLVFVTDPTHMDKIDRSEVIMA